MIANNYNTPHSSNSTLGADFYGPLVFSIFSGVALCAAYTFLLRLFAGKLIVGTLILSFASNVLFALFMVAVSPIIGFILLAFAALTGYVYYSWRSMIPLSEIRLKTIVSICKQFPGMYVAAFMGCFVFIAFAIFWQFSIDAALLNSSNYTNAGLNAILVFHFFVLYWTSQIVNNTIHLTTSGVFATYFYLGVAQGTSVLVPVENPTFASFKRSINSFGSNCFGSLLISIIQTIKLVVSYAKNDAANNRDGALAILGCILECLLGVMGDIVEYFNSYAFTHVAVYGKDYITAAKDTWHLFKERGFHILINDVLVSRVLTLGALAVGFINLLLTLLVSYLAAAQSEETLFGPAILAFIFGIVEFGLFASVIDSGIKTSIVCLAEDPESFAKTAPELYQKVKELYPDAKLK